MSSAFLPPRRPGKLWLDPPELGDHVQASPGPCARCGAEVRLRLQDGEVWFCLTCGQAHYREKWGREAGE